MPCRIAASCAASMPTRAMSAGNGIAVEFGGRCVEDAEADTAVLQPSDRTSPSANTHSDASIKVGGAHVPEHADTHDLQGRAARSIAVRRDRRHPSRRLVGRVHDAVEISRVWPSEAATSGPRSSGTRRPGGWALRHPPSRSAGLACSRAVWFQADSRHQRAVPDVNLGDAVLRLMAPARTTPSRVKRNSWVSSTERLPTMTGRWRSAACRTRRLRPAAVAAEILSPVAGVV